MSDDGRDLILAAFAQARDSGKSDWRRMTSAVLKNRILTLTQNKFHETAYGAATFSEFVQLHGETVRVDHSTFPPIVELREDVSVDRGDAVVRSGTRAWRVRPDLWNAAVDYRSGRRYVWDAGSQVASPVDEPPPGAIILPTLSPRDFQAWRDAFAKGHESSLQENEKEWLRGWLVRGWQTRGLPPRLRQVWNDELKRRVAEYLEHWFLEQHLSVPADFRGLPERTTILERDDAGSLKQFVLRVVRSMTPKELSEIRLPAGAILRAMRRPARGARSLGVSPADDDPADDRVQGTDPKPV